MGSCREQLKLHDLNKGKGQKNKKKKGEKDIYNTRQYKGKKPRFIAHFETGH